MDDSQSSPQRDTTGDVAARRRGKTKWFNVQKGWGFITPLDGGPDIFVHQSVIQMPGFRSLGDDEEVEFECKPSDKGLEATMVTGLEGGECKGSHRRPMSKKKFKKIRCYNCGEFANHIASKCNMGPQPKRCHHCKSSDHLIADCPTLEEKRSSSKKSNGDTNVSSKQSNHTTSEPGSEEESILNAAETASSSSEKHLSDSGLARSPRSLTRTTDDTKSETSATSDGSRGRDV